MTKPLLKPEEEDHVEDNFTTPGTPLMTTYGSGVLLSYRKEDNIYEVRLWTSRGGGSSTAYLNKNAILRKMKASIGFTVSTPMGRGIVISIQEAKKHKNISSNKNQEEIKENKNIQKDIYCIEFSNWTLSTNKKALGYFCEDSVKCTGAMVLPVLEILCNQANLFLQYSATSMNGLVNEYNNNDDGNNNTNFSFLDKLQSAILNSSEILSNKFNENMNDSNIQNNEMIEKGESIINDRIETTKAATKDIINEMKDAEHVETRIKTLLDNARKRVKELTIAADPQAKQLTSEFIDIATNSLSSAKASDGTTTHGTDGIGLDDLVSKMESVEEMSKDTKKMNEIMNQGRDKFNHFLKESEILSLKHYTNEQGEQSLRKNADDDHELTNSEYIANQLGLSELTKSQETLAIAKRSMVEVLKPTLQAAIDITQNESNQEDKNNDQNDKNDEDLEKEAKEAMKIAETFALQEMDIANKKLIDAKQQVEDRVHTLHKEVESTMLTLKELAVQDSKISLILNNLEAEQNKLNDVRKQISSSKALVEILKGKDMISNRVTKLMSAPEVDTLKETSLRIKARLMDKESAARKKTDQLIRAMTSKLQTKLLGVKQDTSDPNKSISSLYDLMNVDSLLESVEGDLIKFLMDKREFVLDSAAPLADSLDTISISNTTKQLESNVANPIKWDPRIQFMVSFIKDCAKVSLREQLELGFDGLKHRLSNPKSFKVPEVAIGRLETALLDLLDSAGGAISLGDLSNFWSFLQKGHSVESAAQEALALLPEEKEVEEFSQKSLSYALLNFGGSVPSPLKKLLLEESGGDQGADKGGNQLVLKQSLWNQFRSGSINEALDSGVGMLNSDSVVDTVHKLVGESSGFLSTIESMREDTRVQAAMATLGSKDMEDKLMAGIEGIDVAELMEDAELAATDFAARQRLVDGMKNACLEFLLQYLPSLPIPPIEGEEDGLEYAVSNMDLSRFKLKKEDVEVKLGDLAGLSKAALSNNKTTTEEEDTKQAKAPAAAATAATTSTPQPDVKVTTEETPDSTILTVTASNISAEFIKLHWSYKQKYFPYLEGGGSCDAVVTGCSISISFEVRKDFRKKRPSVVATPASTTSNDTGTAGAKEGGGDGLVGLKKNMTSGSEGGNVLSAMIDVATGGNVDTSSGMIGEALSAFSSSSGSTSSAPSLIWEPVMILGKCHVMIEDLSMRMSGEGGGSMAWLYNILASLFRQQIREYIITSLSDSIMENAEGLLGTFNGFVRTSWPVLSAATNANLDTLPLLNHNIANNQIAELQKRTSGGKTIAIVLTQPGPLGLHLDINSKRGVIRFTGPVEGGQAEQICKELENQENENQGENNKNSELFKNNGSGLKGAYLTKVNNKAVGGISVSDTLVLLKTQERPLVLSFVLPAMKKVHHGHHHHHHHGHGHGHSGGSSHGDHSKDHDQNQKLETIIVQFKTASLGLKIKQLIHFPQLASVIGFARDPETNEMLPAEASNQIEVGMVLLRVNSEPLWGQNFKQVATKLNTCATAAAEGGPILELTFAKSPDIAMNFPESPTDLLLSVTCTDGSNENITNKNKMKEKEGEEGKYGVVVSGFKMIEMGPVQKSGLILEGDTLLGCNGKNFLTNNNNSNHTYREHVASLRHETYPLTLNFMGLRENHSKNNKNKDKFIEKNISLTINENPSRKLGIVFGCGNHSLPIIRRFEHVPGIAASWTNNNNEEGGGGGNGGGGRKTKPGMLLLQIGKHAIDPDVINAVNKQIYEKALSKHKDHDESGSAHGVVLKDPVKHPVSIEQVHQLLSESQFPDTVIRFRDMDNYLKIKEFSS